MTAALAYRPDIATDRTVTTGDGVRLAVHDHHPASAEATVVLLHGFCLTQASWSRQVQYLAVRWDPKVRILTYDHRGHGQSNEAPTSTYRTDRLAEDLATVLADADVTTPLVLVGHSMGGMTALEYMARPRERRPVEPAGLVLVATAAGRLCQRGLGRLLTTPITNTLSHLAAYTPQQVVRSVARPVCGAVSRYAHCGGDERDTLATLAATAIARTPLSTAVGYLPGLQRYDAYPALKTITAHTVVVSGDADLLTPPAHADDLAAGIAGAEHIHLPGAGHMLPTDAAGAVNDAISRVLNTCILATATARWRCRSATNPKSGPTQLV
jgi:pimeloyl-ACP methyl ester carboxylesterase